MKEEKEDDDAFLSGNMAGSKRKSKSHPCVVRLPTEPDRRSPSGTSLETTFMPAFRGTEAIQERPTPRDKIKGRRDKISRNAALSYRPSTVRSVPLTRPNFAAHLSLLLVGKRDRSNIEKSNERTLKNHRSKILTGIFFRFDRKVSLSNIENI